jgi:hypothetical protein
MSDDITKQLLKIVKKQQEIITKIAQRVEPPPQKIEPQHPELHVAQLVMDSLPAPTARAVQDLVAKADILEVYFKPGMATQQSLDAITRVVQQLGSKGKLPFAYKVRYVG